MSLVCFVGTFVSYLNVRILHTFQDFEFAAFKPFFMKMFKVFFGIPIFIVFGGWAPIGWTSKPLLRSCNFRSFCIFFRLKGV